jgi:hypothetical protein
MSTDEVPHFVLTKRRPSGTVVPEGKETFRPDLVAAEAAR